MATLAVKTLDQGDTSEELALFTKTLNENIGKMPNNIQAHSAVGGMLAQKIEAIKRIGLGLPSIAPDLGKT